MIRSTIRKIVRPMITTLINPFDGLLSRYFVTLDPVLNSSYEMAAPITLTGDFEIEVEFSWNDFTTNSEDCLISSSTGTSMIVVKGTNNATPNLVLLRGEGTSDVILYNGLTGDNKLQKLKVQYNAPNVTIIINGLSTTHTHSSYPITFDQIGVRGFNQTYFDGIIANAKFTDKSGASDVVTTFKLDQATANTESSVEGNNSVNYVNIPQSARDLYTLDGNIWTDAAGNTIEVAP